MLWLAREVYAGGFGFADNYVCMNWRLKGAFWVCEWELRPFDKK